MLQELEDEISQLKAISTHNSSDAFVLVAMGHGGSGKSLYLSDGELIDLEEMLVNPFDGDNWSDMIGKPKVFLFQCCRGKGG